MENSLLNIHEVGNLLNVSTNRLLNWIDNNKLSPIVKGDISEIRYSLDQLKIFKEVNNIINSEWEKECSVVPKRKYSTIELFAGAGGLALGFETAGFEHSLLNEIDKSACRTLRSNRTHWNVVEGDISNVDFRDYKGKIDVVTGGFPCQAFSYAGKKRGFEDTRGTLFYEFARCVSETEPTVFVAENVKGLRSHDGGRTLETIIKVFTELGYTIIAQEVLQAIYYKVPQKRERLFIIGVKNEFADKKDKFSLPSPYKRVLTVKDAFLKGELYDTDVPKSIGVEYNEKKRKVMDMVPEGGYWKDLPIEVQKEYMGGSFYLGGGKTGLARRLSMNTPSLTLVCSPAMKQTERCHPIETRPLTIRESARIQTFPDDWQFEGSRADVYKQIGNAVPVNLACSVARRIVAFLNEIYD